MELEGFTVGVTAGRRAHEQAALLSRLGAEVVVAPAVETELAAEEPLRATTEKLIAAPPGYLAVSSGFGLVTWMDAAARWGLARPLRRSLRNTLVAARGPKAAHAATAAGLTVWWQPETGRLASVTARLLETVNAGDRVALLRDGGTRPDVGRLLSATGAEVVELAAYSCAIPGDQDPALRLVDGICRRRIDAVTFTSGPAVRNLMTLADRARRGRELLAALNDAVLVACVGPVCAAVAVEEGIRRPLHPSQWRLDAMIELAAEELVEQRRCYLVAGIELVLQGSVVLVDGQAVRLTPWERATLAKLAERPGTTISRRVLLRHVWKDPNVDPEVLENTVSQLRLKLGPSGEALETTLRRGYRLRVSPAS